MDQRIYRSSFLCCFFYAVFLSCRFACYVCSFFFLSVCRSVDWSINLCLHLSFCGSTDLPIYLSIYVPIYLSIYLPIYQSTYVSIYPSIYLPNDLSTYWSIYLPISLRICILFCSFSFCSLLFYPILSFSFLLSVLSCPILSILYIFPTYPVCPIYGSCMPFSFLSIPSESYLAQSPAGWASRW